MTIEALNQWGRQPVTAETVYETIIQWDEGGGKRSRRELARRIAALCTAPRQWQGLTEIEFRMLYVSTPDYKSLWEAIEAKLKEKNK